MDYTIAAVGGDISGAALGANNLPTLSAARNINVRAGISATGNTAGLTLTPGTGSLLLARSVSINLTGSNPSLEIAGNSYTVINDESALQNMNLNLTGNDALGSDIDAAATAGWNGGLGFSPVGDNASDFSGGFNGLGRTISGLVIKGGLRSISGLTARRSRDKVSYNAAVATIDIRGTHFGFTLCADDCQDLVSFSGKPAGNGLHVDMTEGSVLALNRAGQKECSTAQTGFILDGDSLPGDVAADDAIRTRIPENVFSSGTGTGQTVGVPSCLTCSVR